jgi:hypothetical protein
MSDRVVDLDAARAARAAKQSPAPVIRFGGKDWTLPAELPWALAEAAGSGSAEAAIGAVKHLLGAQWNEFETHQPTVEDVRVLLEAVVGMYAENPGK